jgi:glutamate racemase
MAALVVPRGGPSSKDPIGVFDSGIGGLTVLKSLVETLPGENFVYLGDTARVPYGNKSPATVTRYAIDNTLFLLQQGIKALVVACNTVSSICLDRLANHFRVPVLGVIEPAARAALESPVSHVAVIGTSATVTSGAYERAIRWLDERVRVTSIACPLFASLVEEGFADHGATDLVIRDYLAGLRSDPADALILGCTHYPLLKASLRRTLGEELRLVDSGPATASQLRRHLAASGLLREEEGPGTVRYCVTDSPARFQSVGEAFLGRPMGAIEVVST